MDAQVRNYGSATSKNEEDIDIRKGPWTVEEDSMLIEYVTIHGEGRWNTAARCAGLKRTGKSCRLRWLNYLRPSVRRGNITLHEQLLILQLHSRWGNRWSKIAQHLPGRTDNEIKNYWRTRVQKQAKQLKCDVNSEQFRDAIRYIWMPRLIERIQAASDQSPTNQSSSCNDITTSSEEAAQTNDHMKEWVMPETSDFLDSQVSPVPGVTEHQNQTSMQSGSGLYLEEECSTWMEMESLESLWNQEDIWFLQQQLI